MTKKNDENIDIDDISDEYVAEEVVDENYQPDTYIENEEKQSVDEYIQQYPHGYGGENQNPYESGILGEQRLTPSQAQMQYLIEPDDVPDNIKKYIWVISRHLELVNIPNERKLNSYKREIRKILRVASWSRKFSKNVPYTDMEQIEFYANLLLTKSLNHGERILLATQITRQQIEDFGERALMQEPDGGGGTGLRGKINNLLGGAFGGR